MAKLITITVTPTTAGATLKVALPQGHSGPDLVRDLEEQLAELKLSGQLVGGGLVVVDGPSTVPCAYVYSHHLGHLFGAVAHLDPKLGGFVVAISHNPGFAVGDLIDAEGNKKG